MIIDIGSGNKNVNFHQGGGGKKVNVEERKSVTYTENGTFAVDPDEGYDAIKGADVTVDVKNGKFIAPTCISFSSSSETEIDISNVDFSNYEGTYYNTNLSPSYGYGLFEDCRKLTSVDMTHFTPINLKVIKGMFSGCYVLKKIDMSNVDMSKCTTALEAFYNCRELVEINFPKKSPNFSWTTYDGQYAISSTFYNCNKLAKIDLSNFVFNDSTIYSFYYTFHSCQSLKELIFPKLDHKIKINNIERMCYWCYLLPSFSFSIFDTSELRNFDYTFQQCKEMAKIDMSNVDTTNLKTFANPFYGCAKLTTILLSSNFFNSTALNTYDFSSATAWTDPESLATFVDALPQLDGTTKTVKLSTNTKAALTDDQKTTIANKGWTIA